MNAEPTPDPATAPSRRPRMIRYLPLAGLALVALIAWWTGALHGLAPQELARHAAQLRAAAAAQPLLTLAGFILAYAVLTGACLPVALILSLLGGAIFGRLNGSIGVWLGAAGGAMITYAAARSAFASALLARARRDPRLRKIMDGFDRDAFSYVLTLRLIPLFPFALVNIGAGLVAAPARAYAAATLLGGIPTAAIYASLGAGLGASLGSEHDLMRAARAPGVILPMAALAVLSLAPYVFRQFRRPKPSA